MAFQLVNRSHRIQRIDIELDHAKDESYCPLTLIVMAGDAPHLLLDVDQFTMAEREDHEVLEFPDRPTLKVLSLRLLITANLSNGKDSRIRRIRLWKEKNTDDSVDFIR